MMRHTIIILFLALFVAAPIWSLAQNNPVPKGYKLKKEEDYKKYEKDVLKCIEWFDNTPLGKYPAIRQEVSNFLLAWHEGTPYVSIMVSALILKGVEENPTLILTFMNGWSKYVIEGGNDNDNKVEAYLTALNHTLDTYKNTQNGFVESKQMDKLLKARDKDQLKGMVEKEVGN